MQIWQLSARVVAFVVFIGHFCDMQLVPIQYPSSVPIDLAQSAPTFCWNVAPTFTGAETFPPGGAEAGCVKVVCANATPPTTKMAMNTVSKGLCIVPRIFLIVCMRE